MITTWSQGKDPGDLALRKIRNYPDEKYDAERARFLFKRLFSQVEAVGVKKTTLYADASFTRWKAWTNS